MRQTLKTLCGLFGPSGCEDAVRAWLRGQLEPLADQILEDPAGNLLVYKKGAKHLRHTVLLSAYMDEPGLIVREIEDDGFLRFAPVGSADCRYLPGKKVLLGSSGIPGILGMKPIHLTSKEERQTIPKTKELYIDVGARSKEEAEKLVPLGTYGCFASEPLELSDQLLCAKALPGRAGCAVLLELAKQALPVDTWFAFTVQHRIGSKGAFGAAFRIKPDLALILDGYPAGVCPDKANAPCLQPGSGPVIAYMDHSALYDRSLTALLEGVAREKEIPFQPGVWRRTDTEARGIQRSLGGCKAAVLGLTVRDPDSPLGCCSVADVLAMKSLAEGFLAKLEDNYG